MKKFLMLAALVAVAFLPMTAQAGPIGDTGTYSQTRIAGHYSGSGGEFTVYGYTNLTNDGYAGPAKNVANAQSFQTFCVESNEYTTNPTSFVVNSAAVAGGSGGGTPDPLSVGTAWLYSQFALGVLSGYDYTGGSGRSASAGLLQNALWYLEDEASGSANVFTALAVSAFGSLVNAKADAAVGAYGVYVLNAYDAQGAKAQDFLYRVPDGGATLSLLGGALLGLAALRRRMR